MSTGEMFAPRISVCIANYNGAGLIEECIASVLAQTLDTPLEIIVHDDASPDASASLVRERFPQVRLIESTENVGFCVANNRMAAAAQGAYLLLLNNDATLWSDALASLLAEAQRLAAPAILTLPQYDAATGELLDIGSRLDPFLNAVPNRQPGAEIGMVAGACLWIDKALWDELGGFPDWFGSLAEDLYLCCCARLAGHTVRALPISGYRHRVGANLGGGRISDGKLQTTFRRRALTERNKTFVMAMVYPAPYMQALLPLHLLLLAAEGVLLSLLKGRLAYLRRIYLPVFGALWRSRGKIRAQRRRVLQIRRLASADFFAVFDKLPYKLRMLKRHGLPRLD